MPTEESSDPKLIKRPHPVKVLRDDIRAITEGDDGLSRQLSRIVDRFAKFVGKNVNNAKMSIFTDIVEEYLPEIAEMPPLMQLGSLKMLVDVLVGKAKELRGGKKAPEALSLDETVKLYKDFSDKKLDMVEKQKNIPIHTSSQKYYKRMSYGSLPPIPNNKKLKQIKEKNILESNENNTVKITRQEPIEQKFYDDTKIYTKPRLTANQIEYRRKLQEQKNKSGGQNTMR